MSFCPNCGTSVTSEFCPNCGTNVAEVLNGAKPVEAEAPVEAEPVAVEAVEAEAVEVAEEVVVENVEVEEPTVVEPVVVEEIPAAPVKKKKSKVLLIIAAVVVLLVVGIFALGSTGSDPLVGEWKMQAYSDGGDYQSGSFSTAVFESDHTGVVTIGEKDFPITWEFTKSNDEISLYTLELSGGDTLVAGLTLADEDTESDLMMIRASDDMDLFYRRAE